MVHSRWDWRSHLLQGRIGLLPEPARRRLCLCHSSRNWLPTKLPTFYVRRIAVQQNRQTQKATFRQR